MELTHLIQVRNGAGKCEGEGEGEGNPKYYSWSFFFSVKGEVEECFFAMWGALGVWC